MVQLTINNVNIVQWGSVGLGKDDSDLSKPWIPSVSTGKKGWQCGLLTSWMPGEPSRELEQTLPIDTLTLSHELP